MIAIDDLLKYNQCPNIYKLHSENPDYPLSSSGEINNLVVPRIWQGLTIDSPATDEEYAAKRILEYYGERLIKELSPLKTQLPLTYQDKYYTEIQAVSDTGSLLYCQTGSTMLKDNVLMNLAYPRIQAFLYGSPEVVVVHIRQAVPKPARILKGGFVSTAKQDTTREEFLKTLPPDSNITPETLDKMEFNEYTDYCKVVRYTMTDTLIEKTRAYLLKLINTFEGGSGVPNYTNFCSFCRFNLICEVL